MTRELDALRADRRRLPWVKVEKPYVSNGFWAGPSRGSPHTAATMMGTSIFARNESVEIFHMYSTFARGIENLMGAFMWLDLTHRGRHEFDDGRSRLSEDGLRDVSRDDRNDSTEYATKPCCAASLT